MSWYEEDDRLDPDDFDPDLPPELLDDLDIPAGGSLHLNRDTHGETRFGSVRVEHTDGWFIPSADPTLDIAALVGERAPWCAVVAHRLVADRYRASVTELEGPWVVSVLMTGDPLAGENSIAEVLDVLDDSTAAWQLDDEVSDGTLAGLLVEALGVLEDQVASTPRRDLVEEVLDSLSSTAPGDVRDYLADGQVPLVAVIAGVLDGDRDGFRSDDEERDQRLDDALRSVLSRRTVSEA